MHCSCVYIFKNKEDRRNIEKYQKLANLIMKVDNEIYPDCLAKSLRSDYFWSSYDNAGMTSAQRRAEHQDYCNWIENLLDEIQNSNWPLVSVEKYRNAKGQGYGTFDEYVLPIGGYLMFVKDAPDSEFAHMLFAIKAYLSGYHEYDFQTEKGDVFLWASGHDSAMNTKQLLAAAETDEEKALAESVFIGYSRHVKEGYWFKDLAEPKLPSWREKFGA